MKSKDSHLPDNAKCVQQKGTVTLAAMMLILVTVLAISALPNLSVIISAGFKDVIITIVAAQAALQSFSGRREKQ